MYRFDHIKHQLIYWSPAGKVTMSLDMVRDSGLERCLTLAQVEISALARKDLAFCI